MRSCGSFGRRRATSLGSVKPDALSHLVNLARSVPSIAEMFQASPNRAEAFTVDAVGIHADFSRQRISGDLWAALFESAKECGIEANIARMFAGDIMNVTEDRAVLHTALRADASTSAEARWASSELQKVRECARAIRSNPNIHTVVNIGIGGSDLGPAMATRALRRFASGPDVRFVSNVDAADLDSALTGLQPQNTVFVVSSKTFTTSETMHNAERARQWVRAAGGDWETHFYAATARPEIARQWGVREANIFQFRDWVGGRFSLSSVIGFPVMCAIGPDSFDAMLMGMRDMDAHVASAPLHRNLPIAHALVWFTNVVLHGCSTAAVVPYSHDLSRLPAYLQQLVMESNGKGVSVDGEAIATATSPVVWGEPGTNGQHAFFQMLHQGTQVVPVEFISSVEPLGSDQEAHDILIANMMAQSEALAIGEMNTNPHRQFLGNRPSSVLMLDALSPRTFGALVAMYEHSTAIQGWLLNVNSFDQFGVELGKTMAVSTLNAFTAGGSGADETLTHPLMSWYLAQRKNISNE